MPDLIILRLLPAEPTSAEEFRRALDQLTIRAYDLRFANTGTGDLLGTASGPLADWFPGVPSNNSVNINNTPIIQHYVNIYHPITHQPVARYLLAAATAVIVINVPGGRPEYPSPTSFDIRLEIQRGAPPFDIIIKTINYNVTTTSPLALSNDQRDYFDRDIEIPPFTLPETPNPYPTSAYVILPPAAVGRDPTRAYVNLPSNGDPPNFNELRTAINLVLAKDPDAGPPLADLTRLSPLTLAQSKHVAAEIVWNPQLYPPPNQPRPLGMMYTDPPIDAALIDENERNRRESDRKQFEGQRQGYQSIHDAEAARLAGFVFAASAAVACEQMSANATRAGLTFPIITPPGASTLGTVHNSTVFLTSPPPPPQPPLDPAFTIDAAYFYALGAKLAPRINAQQRYENATLDSESRLLAEFQAAIEAGVIETIGLGATAINPDQAARRLHALGSTTGSFPEVILFPPPPPNALRQLIVDWLAYSGTTANINNGFWENEVSIVNPGGYLELILRAVTDNHQPLIDAVRGQPPLNVNTVADLVAVSDKQWQNFFLGPPPPPGTPPRLNLLPPFTVGGTPAVRVAAFINYLRNFFTVQYSASGQQGFNLGQVPTLDLSICDVFEQFANAWSARGGGTFTFGSAWNVPPLKPTLRAALNDVFADDKGAQAWLQKALETIDSLYKMTYITPSVNNIVIGTNPGTAVQITLTGTSPIPGDVLTFSIVAPPQNGNLSAVSATNTVTYTPDGSFVGIDTFTYKATNSQGVDTNTATVKIAVGVPLPPDPPNAELHFSLMEALFARGFTNASSVLKLPQSDFRQALVGTVAYPKADAIHSKAGQMIYAPKQVEGEFKPVNPDGSLANCIPPLHLSPLGPVEYLHELLKASQISTCEDPMPDKGEEGEGEEPMPPPVLGKLLEDRRGPLGNLQATRANLQTPLPLIDLVNENLEALAAGLPTSSAGRADYNTSNDELGGHKLRSRREGACHESKDCQAPFLHDPITLFEALPEHSSPATPVKQPDAYNLLKNDFTSPLLPYSQSLDISRSYLSELCTSRYAVMRRFRKDITEFVLDPTREPADFRRYLWRYPFRIEIAVEYLCISPEEYKLLFTRDIITSSDDETPSSSENRLNLWRLYGFESESVISGPEERSISWTEVVVKVSEFLKRTGLTYCEFIDLWRSEFVKFNRADNEEKFPECEPCCLDQMRIQFVHTSEDFDELQALKQLAVFIRLWQKLRKLECVKYTFIQLRDICEVLHLFISGSINPDFIRQLAAFQILRDNWNLALVDKSDTQSGGLTGADRTHILALWAGKNHRKWTWAVDELLDKIKEYAESQCHCGPRSPELIKLIYKNLDALSILAGFYLATDAAAAAPNLSNTWHFVPTHTLRFVELLTKFYASDFQVGEILFLFTADDHLRGEDPFPLGDENEALDSPLHLPDDEDEFSLWTLRRRLLDVHVSEKDADTWTWPRIENSLREDFGYSPSAAAAAPFPPPQQPGTSDALNSLGEHFFPSILESYGRHIDLTKRQYQADLPNTPPMMWNTPPDGPFRYESDTEKLWTQIPLKDDWVIEKLSHIRQLNPSEQNAVQELYFLPRRDLARFAFIFENFGEAEEYLIQEPDERKRWNYFQCEFARFHARCCIIAEHLARHVTAVTHQGNVDGVALAWRLLRHLLADENLAKGPWEDPLGKPPGERPDVTWGPQPNGGAFAALLGLTGTGLLEEFTTHGGGLVWREARGPMRAFGPEKNEWNSPVPTVLPSMKLTLSPDEERFAAVRNGFAMRNSDGANLGGAQGFIVRWSGMLLIEKEGMYEFCAGPPSRNGEKPHFEVGERRNWRVTLKRGQRTWVLINHGWGGGGGEDAPPVCSPPMSLRRGAYHLTIEFRQPQPTFSRAEDACPQFTGFEVKYCGPDTDNKLIAIPLDRLFRNVKDGTLAAQIDWADRSDAARHFLELHFTSTLRDIRRTYQRAFKALLFAYRFCLSAKLIPGDVQSEIGYLLDHAELFLGTSYYRESPTSEFKPHYAYFDFNFLPVNDPFHPPSQDERSHPSVKRQQALFDWWERILDYVRMRKETRSALEPPAWLLFYHAAQRQPDDAAQLLRHLGIDNQHGPLVLNYYHLEDPADPSKPDYYTISSPDLEDERWAIRAWHTEKWIRNLLCNFLPKVISDARTDLWASDDPNAVGKLLPGAVGQPQSGNENLTKFFRDGCIENGEPRRYEEIRHLNDGLRQRARAALLTYLCSMNRVSLEPLTLGGGGSGGTPLFAQVPNDLTNLLLQDVQVGVCERASRIEDAISAVQTYVQRARLGLEPRFTVSPPFVQVWDQRFSTFRVWEACKRREVYRENWIEWDELREARKTEAFRFLESKLRQLTLTVPLPGGLEWWPNQRPPAHPPLTTLQASEPSTIKLLPRAPEGLGLLGTPERDARPSWLAPIIRICSNQDGDDDGDDGSGPILISSTDSNNSTFNDDATTPGENASGMSNSSQVNRLPLWIQAAYRLGSDFVRVAAAGVPPASTAFDPDNQLREIGCCSACGKVHPPVIDEYYFWLQNSRYFDEKKIHSFDDLNQGQDADVGAQSPDDPTKDPTSDWHKSEKLPRLLHWDSSPMVHLFWCRVHNGEFQQPRRSSEGLRIAEGTTKAHINFEGRSADSLVFTVPEGQPYPGYDGTDISQPGFRYDMATDTAVVLPLVSSWSLKTGFPGGLKVYPYFAYFSPGAHLQPLSLFAVAHAVSGVLRPHCRFEAALKWYELIFNPLIRDNTWMQCPKDDGNEEEEHDNDEDEGDNGIVVGVASSNDNNNNNNTESRSVSDNSIISSGSASGNRENDGRNSDGSSDVEPCCPSAPVGDDVARDRSILLQYLETLLQWGEAQMCRNSPEAFRHAGVIFDTIERILGAHPVTVLTQDDEEKNKVMTVATFVPRAPPLNPRLLSLYDRTSERLALLHHCLNAYRLRNGRPNIDMAYWGNSSLRNGWQTLTMIETCENEDEWCLWCCSPYRFVFLVQKAIELAGEVRGLGAELLAAYEKGDAEYLASLRATHERQLQQLTLEVRQNQWREADWQLQALRKTKEGAHVRRRYYQILLENGLNAGETRHVSLTEVSRQSHQANIGSEENARASILIPDFSLGGAGFAGSPLLFNQLPIGSKIGAFFSTTGRIQSINAGIASLDGSLALTESGWNRREEEWRHQVQVIGIELEQIERQILAAERMRDRALRELNNHQKTVEHSVEVQDFLRDKFTSHELYLFLQQETAALHNQAYELARFTARQAQRAFNYERGYTARTFLPDYKRDNLHEGLMAGEKLQLAVRQMEKAYLDANCREYELTKHISLLLNFPMAFLSLKMTGYCEVEIPEWMFDLDYPGHYMRRIKNLTLTIPSVVGPYTGVHCRVTLLSSTTRVDPRLDESPHSCCCSCDGPDINPHDICCCSSQQQPSSCSCCCQECKPKKAYETLPDDPRIVKQYAATEAIATSSAQNDSGMFELNFRDERYLPFEFAGAVSRWRIELPQENNHFDIDTVSDVILHLNYTSREGGDVLRRAANKVAQLYLPGNGLRIFDLKRELPDVWQLFQYHHTSAAEGGKRSSRELGLRLSRNMFPFIPCRHKDVRIHRLELFFETKGANPGAHKVVEFLVGHKAGHHHNPHPNQQQHHNSNQDSCRCEVRYIDCIASSEWSCLFHGVIDIQLGPLSGDEYHDLGTFRFQPDDCEITRAFLFCGYNVKRMD